MQRRLLELLSDRAGAAAAHLLCIIIIIILFLQGWPKQELQSKYYDSLREWGPEEDYTSGTHTSGDISQKIIFRSHTTCVK